MEEIEFLPLVKAYPALSHTYGEVSCVAGVTYDDAPEWIRLYPVPFRSLDEAQQFAKYQPIRVQVETHSGDRRPETRRPNRDSIEVISDPIASHDGWQLRKRFIEPLMAESMCGVISRQKTDGTSLAVFRPRDVQDLVIEQADVNQEKIRIAEAWAAQPSLLDQLDRSEQAHQVTALELIPWSFKYRYRCADPQCRGHVQSIIDWEISQFFRRVRHRNDWRERLRTKWWDELCAPTRDTAFFVGNMHQHPGSFLVLGVWWPEWRPEQLTLGDFGDL